MPHRRIIGIIPLFAATLQFSAWTATRAEDGYRLWLRYDRLPERAIEAYRPRITSVVVPDGSATLDAIRAELVDGCSGLLGGPVPVAEKVDRDGALVVGTPRDSPTIAALGWGRQLADLGPEGFLIRSVEIGP